MVLRTLYTALGARGWRLHLIGLGGRLPPKLLAESRVPISVALSNIDEAVPEEVEGPVYAVDPRGEPAWRLEEPGLLVLDYSGGLQKALGAIPVSGAGLPSLTYEAAAVIYEFFVRRRVPPPPTGEAAYSRDPRSGVYLARKLLEAITVMDNYVVLEPSVVVFTLRRVYLARGIYLDASSYRVEIEPREGRIREVIEADAYTKRYRLRGRVRAVYEGRMVSIEDWEGVAYRIELDAERRVACPAPGLCVGEGAGEPGEAPLGALGLG